MRKKDEGEKRLREAGTCAEYPIYFFLLAVLKKDMQAGQLALYNVAVGQGKVVWKVVDGATNFYHASALKYPSPTPH